MRFEVVTLSSELKFDLYIFPSNREIKPYCVLYTDILPIPSVILYAISTDCHRRENTEWLSLFQDNSAYKMAFISNAKTYMERQQALSRVNSLFISDVSRWVYFPLLSSEDFDNCFYNLGHIGISMHYYNRVVLAFTRIKWIWKRLTNRKKSQE